MENCRARHESFPAGLHVLVVDDDPTWLKILEKMLRKCSYEVTTCGLARVALDMLRERRNRFDIVISDVNMPDMDGFKLLEQVGLEMDLPVIMMSVDGETSRVMKGVQHGACDYLLKPVRMKELKNIWQHVFRKKIHEVREIENYEGHEEIYNNTRGRTDEFDEILVFNGGGLLHSSKKRKDSNIDQNPSNPVSVKKARIVWSVDLHQKFVNAVNLIGLDKVGPKKILDLMNVPGLTRENVASHLQKYRLYLSRLQKQGKGKSQTDVDAKNPFLALTQRSQAPRQQKNPQNGNEFSSQISYTHDIINPKMVSVMQAESAQTLTKEENNNLTHIVKLMKDEKNPGLEGKVIDMHWAASKENKHPMIWNCGVNLVNSQINHPSSTNIFPFQETCTWNHQYLLGKRKSISSWSTLTSTEAVGAQSVNIESPDFPQESNGFLENSDQDSQRFLYDELQNNCEYLFDFYDAPLVYDGLFT